MKSKIISLRDKILCDQNIYSAIYSIDTSIVEKTLLSKSDIGQLQNCHVKFMLISNILNVFNLD